jgi:hypothetical protein
VHREPDDWYGLPISDEERERLKVVEARLPRALSGNKLVFQPFLLIRTFIGDHGERPYGGRGYESPDISVSQGDPGSTPEIPPHVGGVPRTGQPNTLYAHVWNLGLAPLIGVHVEFLVFDPSIDFTGQVPLFRGVGRVDLGSRTAPTECHKMVKCPTPWIPTFANDGHQCVIVRATGLGESFSPLHQFQPKQDRHVAQRNMNIAPFGSSQQRLIWRLKKTLPKGAELELYAAGREAQTVVDLLAPGLKVNPRTKQHRISGIEAAPAPGKGEVTVVRLEGVRRREVLGGFTLVLVP